MLPGQPSQTSTNLTSRDLTALIEVFKALTLPLELPDLFQQVLARIVELLGPADTGMVLLWDQNWGLLRPVASYGVDHTILRKLELRLGESITGRVFKDGQPVLYPTREDVEAALVDTRPGNLDILVRSLGANHVPKSAIAAPIFKGDNHYGVLILDNLYGDSIFTTEDLFLVQTLAELMALTVERVRLEARADAVRAVEEEEHVRYELMASLSHELRLPLTAIKGYSTALLLDQVDWKSAKVKEFLRKIDQEVDQMQAMIKDLLDSALLEVHQLKPELEPLRLPLIARDVAQEVQRRTAMHSIRVEFPAGFPIVLGDSRWIKQVIRNLIDNAIKYSPDGGPVILSGISRASDVVVSITDHGMGIPSEDLIPIFEKFTRVRSANTLRIPGIGLGLPISRTIIEAHGGKLWVESRVGHGTTAYFSLPLQTSPSEGGGDE